MFFNSNRFATPGGHSGLEASRSSNFENEGFQACKEQKATTSTPAKTKENCSNERRWAGPIFGSKRRSQNSLEAKAKKST